MEEPNRPSPSSSDKVKLLLEVETYKLMEKDKDIMYENILNFFQIILKHLNEKIQARLNSVYENYSLMMWAIELSQKDKELAMQILKKWVPRAKSIKLILVGVGQYEYMYPQVHPIYEFVCELSEQKFQGYIGPLEKKIIKLVNKYDLTNLSPLLDIQIFNDELKPLKFWKREMNEVINAQVNEICKEVDIGVFNETLYRLTFFISFLDDFDKESNAMVTKYSPYKNTLDKFIGFN